MTRTDPPDIQVSTVYQDIDVKPTYTHSNTLRPSKQCDRLTTSTLENKQERIDKRYCRSFDFESLDDPTPRTSSMEHPYGRPERHMVNSDVTWNALGQQGHLRFSSPDLFNNRPPHHQAGADAVIEVARMDLNRRARSKSAPRAKTALTPVHFEASPPVARRGRDVHRAPRDLSRRPEASPHMEASHTANRAFMNEVHPIKLQPQRGDASRCSPLYVSDRFDSKPATSPHVRCRVDIKPDLAVLQHAGRKIPAFREVPWQRYPSGGSRSLTVPRQTSTSRTPTPTPSESFSGEYRHMHPYPSYVPNSYVPSTEVPLQRMPSPRESRGYFGKERRAHSSPNVPTKLIYADDPGRYPAPSRTYYPEDHYSISSQNFTPKVEYVQNPRTRMVHTTPARPYYSETEHCQCPLQSMYSRGYSTSEPGPYIIDTSPTQMYYREDPRAYQFQTAPPNVFYTEEPFVPPEPHMPFRAYHTEGRRRPRTSLPQADDWYSPELSAYATHRPPSHTSQFTPQRARQDPMLTPWYANPCTEPAPARLGADARLYSKSWDNILNTQVEREPPVQRGRSYENLLYQEKRSMSPDDRRQPVVVNLSSSPRRYAALSLSENSLMDRSPTDSGRNTMGRFWFVTPEITITDNDIRSGNLNKTEVRSASWDALESGRAQTSHREPLSYSAETTKEKTHNSSSLQQSLEQLDELLADLVVDYKPPTSRRPSEELLGQLKKLINEDETRSSTKDKESEDLSPLNKQPMSAKTTTNALKDLDGDSDGHQKSTEEGSPDQSTDEDETMICSNSKCRRTETLFNACLYFKSCHSCYTYYCSRNCRREDWDVHKENCMYGRIGSVCRHLIKHCRETAEVHKAFSRIAKVGFLSRGRGVLFLGFPNPGASNNFLQNGLESLLMSPTYLSLRELDGFKDNLGDYGKELQEAGNEYDPGECFLLNVSIAVGEPQPDRPSPRVQAPTVRKYAKVSLASSSPEKKVLRKDGEMETLILTPPPGTADIDKEGEEGRKAREICFINIQRELRTRGVFLRHEYPHIYQQLCEFVENNRRFTPTTIYPIDKRTGKQFMCMIMAASEPRTLDWLGTPNLLDDII